jgi:hypothetical protein
MRRQGDRRFGLSVLTTVTVVPDPVLPRPARARYIVYRARYQPCS